MTSINDIMHYHKDAMKNGGNDLEIVIVDIVLDDINGVDDGWRRISTPQRSSS
jgi:hypothetical protein